MEIKFMKLYFKQEFKEITKFGIFTVGQMFYDLYLDDKKIHSFSCKDYLQEEEVKALCIMYNLKEQDIYSLWEEEDVGNEA